MTVVPFLRPPIAEGLLEQRLCFLMDVLADAQSELADALLSGQMGYAIPAARKLASLGWLFRDAVDRYERPRSCA